MWFMAIADGAVSSTRTSGFDDGTVTCNCVQSAFLVRDITGTCVRANAEVVVLAPCATAIGDFVDVDVALLDRAICCSARSLCNSCRCW